MNQIKMYRYFSIINKRKIKTKKWRCQFQSEEKKSKSTYNEHKINEMKVGLEKASKLHKCRRWKLTCDLLVADDYFQK